MKAMSYEQTGRSRQKHRTREQLIDATRTLIAENGAAPTVAEAAAAAHISRTTAYRYFPNQKALLVAAHPETAMAPPFFPLMSAMAPRSVWPVR